MRILFWFYLRLCSFLYFSPLLGWFGVRHKRIQAFRKPTWEKNIPAPAGTHTTWFHAASVGELEILFPMIEAWVQKGIPTAVSVFSDSALSFLDRLPAGLLYRGFSPPESDWRSLFERYRVNRVIVSKYEAWPGLWMACGDLSIPLLMINAQWRKSLLVAKKLLSCFGASEPRVFFFVLDESHESALKAHFSRSFIQKISDPRWMRVLTRAGNAADNPRVQAFRDEAAKKKLPRPFVVVGSAWKEDLDAIIPAFMQVQGTLWVVPHSLKSKNLKRMESKLNRTLPDRSALIKEMGILLELYSIADRVWVGGGFGAGIHSTMEPVVYSVPVACGPHRAEAFYETLELQAEGRLVLCEPDEILAWLERPVSLPPFNGEQKVKDFDRLIEDCIRIR